MCVSVKSITCMTSCLPMYQCVDTTRVQLSVPIIKPPSSTPEWLAAKNSTCTMNLWRDIRPTLTAQLTVSVVNNRVFGVYNHNVRCFPVASHLGLQAGGNHNFNDRYSGWLTTFLHSLATQVEIDVTHAVQENLQPRRFFIQWEASNISPHIYDLEMRLQTSSPVIVTQWEWVGNHKQACWVSNFPDK